MCSQYTNHLKYDMLVHTSSSSSHFELYLHALLTMQTFTPLSEVAYDFYDKLHIKKTLILLHKLNILPKLK